MSAQGHPERKTADTGRHLLLAVDETDSSRRAVMFVADFFGGYRDLAITLLTIIPEPPEDLHRGARARQEALEEQRRAREVLCSGYKKLLVGGGIAAARIDTRVVVRRCTSVGDAILEEQERLRCCIVAVGRRRISRHEEFMFGSTSSRILHRASACAVLVVE
jgi:nucleotide-binding universal stress UspA family protein